jgi:YHS domain-containing protein
MKTLIVVLVSAVSLSAFSAFAGCCGDAPKAACPITLAAAADVQKDAAAAPAGKAQTICPVMGEPINKEVFVDYDGKRVYFCCKMCQAKFKEDPAKYLHKLSQDGVTLEDAPAAPK